MIEDLESTLEDVELDFTFHISSSKNVSFSYEEDFDISDMGYVEEDWIELSEDEREQVIHDYIKHDILPNYIEYGWG